VLDIKQTANIGARLWYFRYESEGLRFAKCTGGDDGTRDWDLFMKFMENRKSDSEKESVKATSVDIENDPRGASAPIQGFLIPTEESAEFMETWFREVVLKSPPSSAPCFIFERAAAGVPRATSFTAASCMDYVFGTNCFRNGFSFLYRDGGIRTVSLQINEVPVVSKIRRRWAKWSSQMRIVDASPRFLLVARSRKLGLYTLGIPSTVMSRIQSAGFSWNRNHQLWLGNEGEADMDRICELIRIDSLPGPELLGFVPEWYCPLSGERPSTGSEGGRIAVRGMVATLLGRG